MSEIILNNQKIYLDKVVFNRVAPIQTKNGLKVFVDDNISDLKVFDGILELRYYRHICLEPKSFFDVSIEFVYRANYDEAINSEKMKQMVETNIASIIDRTTMPSVASQIVANLTSINGGTPLITNPHFVAR